ncbi:single-stranded DNA binding protein [Synechococcus phage S-CBM2]|nr:single-stranded DNA binding protein [Synechococcus phage S-CBM2]
MSFAALKKSSYFDNLKNEIEKISNPSSGSNVDDRFWKPEMDKSGNGYAVIRFLPPPEGEDLPFAKVWSHAFQGPGGKWYIENSLTTIGKDDPVGQINRDLWNSGLESDKEIARKQKRKLSYYSNIYVVKDPLHPENEGKVFLYKFGKKIFDKILEAMQPQFEDERPVDVFNFWEGANFKLKLVKQAGFWNYDKSEFDRPSVLGDFSDGELEKIYKQQYSLTEFTDAKNFKTYEELEARLNLVLGKVQPRVTPRIDEEVADEEEVVFSKAPTWTKEVENHKSAPSEDEDDSLDYFKRLAEEDF